jgi:hypothetical protein
MMTVYYNPLDRPLDGAGTVVIHRGHNGWQGITDEFMTWNPVEMAWEVTFLVPVDAGSVDIVFNDGASTWDNNGGADWHVPATGTTGYALDGFLDDGVPLLAGRNGLSLWGEWVDGLLYLATDGTGSSAGLDHFLLITADTTSITVAPWAKAGSAVAWAYFLGAENQTGWTGWFDSSEMIQTGPAFGMAQGSVLEGTLDIAALYPVRQPAQLWVAAAGYESPDGGALILQAPAGDGDGLLEVPEYHEMTNPLTGVEDNGEGLPALPWRLSLHPNPFNPSVAVHLFLPQLEPLRVEVYDLAGHKLATLHDGPAGPGPQLYRWNGHDDRGSACASGVYFIRARGETESRVVKGALLR